MKKICDKYLSKKCSIEVIDLTKNPSFAITDQIVAIPTLVRKNYHGKRIIGDLSNQDRVLEFLDLSLEHIMGADTEEVYIVNTPKEESKTDAVRSNKSKYDLQPYIGNILCMRLSQTMYNLIFSLS